MRNLVKKMLTLVVSLPLLMPNVVRTGAASGTPHTQTVYAVNDGVSAMTGHTIYKTQTQKRSTTTLTEHLRTV